MPSAPSPAQLLLNSAMQGKVSTQDGTQLMMLRVLRKIQTETDENGSGDMGQSAKALRKLHSAKQEVYTQPRLIVHDYMLEAMTALSTEMGDPS